MFKSRGNGNATNSYIVQCKTRTDSAYWYSVFEPSGKSHGDGRARAQVRSYGEEKHSLGIVAVRAYVHANRIRDRGIRHVQ